MPGTPIESTHEPVLGTGGDDVLNEAGDFVDGHDGLGGNDPFVALAHDPGHGPAWDPFHNAVFHGGSGLDTLSCAQQPIPASPEAGIAQRMRGGLPQSTDTLVRVEGLAGGARSDHLTGWAKANQLLGFEGHDPILGPGRRRPERGRRP